MTERASIRDLPDLLAEAARPTKRRPKLVPVSGGRPWPGACVLDVRGEPASEGSTRAIPSRDGRRAVVVHGGDKNMQAKLKAWRGAVAAEAEAWRLRNGQPELAEGPVRLRVEFYMRRPKTVKRSWPAVAPDLDKLLRGASDALTGLVWRDDSQVVEQLVREVYADDRPPGARLEVVTNWKPWAW